MSSENQNSKKARLILICLCPQLFRRSFSRRRALALGAVLIALTGSCSPPDQAADPRADPVVIVYRSDTQRGPGVPVVLAPKPILCDGLKVADLGNHRAFAVRLSAGEHSFKLQDQSDWFAENVEAETGKVYYLVLYGGRLLDRGRNHWLQVALDFRPPRPRYAPETRLNLDLLIGEYVAPHGVTLLMVGCTKTSMR